LVNWCHLLLILDEWRSVAIVRHNVGHIQKLG
jgi:hypothetical protein